MNTLEISALKWVKSNSNLPTDIIENQIFNDLISFVDNMLLFWSLEDRSFCGFTPIDNVNIVEQIIQEGDFENLQQFFHDAQFEDELTHKDITGSELLYIKYDNRFIEFNMVASTGMRSLLLAFYWLSRINKPTKVPSFICIDEFDAFYHFELSCFLVEKLKKFNCQVLLTTHNTTLFNNDLLRPDCYYICTKERITNINNATEKELRFGHNLEKLYRGGAFEI